MTEEECGSPLPESPLTINVVTSTQTTTNSTWTFKAQEREKEGPTPLEGTSLPHVKSVLVRPVQIVETPQIPFNMVRDHIIHSPRPLFEKQEMMSTPLPIQNKDTIVLGHTKVYDDLFTLLCMEYNMFHSIIKLIQPIRHEGNIPKLGKFLVEGVKLLEEMLKH